MSDRLEEIFGPDPQQPHWRPAKVDEADTHKHEWRPITIAGLTYEFCGACRAERESGE